MYFITEYLDNFLFFTEEFFLFTSPADAMSLQHPVWL